MKTDSRNVANNPNNQLLAYGLSVITETQREVQKDAKNSIEDDVVLLAFALQDEVAELVDAVGWKPWKDEVVIDEERRKDIAMEYADILAFLGLLTGYVMNKAGLTPLDLANAYRDKVRINLARMRGEVDGYKNPPTIVQRDTPTWSAQKIRGSENT